MKRAELKPLVRLARETDARDITRLWRELFDLHAALDPIFAVAQGGEAYYRDWLLAQFELSDTFIHVVELSGRVIAFCHSQIKVLPPMLEYRRIGVISDMAVDEAWRGRGIGRVLFARVEADLLAAGVDRLELKTSSLNAQSNHFWQKVCGFSEFVRVHYKEFSGP